MVCLIFIASLTKQFAYAFYLSCLSIFLACLSMAIQIVVYYHILISTRRFRGSFGVDMRIGAGFGLTIGAFALAFGDLMLVVDDCNTQGRKIIERRNQRQLRGGDRYPLPMFTYPPSRGRGSNTSNSQTLHQTSTTRVNFLSPYPQSPRTLSTSSSISWSSTIESNAPLRSADAVHTHDSKPKRQVTLERKVNLERGYDCPICFEKSEVYQSLRCKHTFCSHCIKTALGARQLCPLCNGPAAVEDLRPVNRVPTFASDKDKDTVEAPKDFSSSDAPLDTSRISISTFQ